MEREGQRKMKWAGSLGAVRHSLQVESPGTVPFIFCRNLEASASRPSQPTSILSSEVGYGGGLSIVQGGGPMVGGFTEGEVPVANQIIWTLFSEGDVMVDV